MLKVFCANASSGPPCRTPIRCAIYTRQSVENETELTSCEVQFEVCRAHVTSLRALGLELIDGRFDDEGYSGTTLDRPALQRLLALIRSGGVDKLVVYALDRLSRNLRHYVTLFEELREHNVGLEVVSAPSVGPAALDNLMLSILASFAEFERDMMATRMAESRDYLKSHGRRVAGAVPFGYQADPHTKQLVVCQEEAAAVVRLFELAAKGVPPSVIATYANALRWVTGGGGPWTARQVLSILTNRVYVGYVAHRSGFRSGCHPALIDNEIFDTVQSQIVARRTRFPNSRRGARSAIAWPLLGRLVCGGCGRLMSTHTTRSGPVIRRYYRCRSTAGGVERCKGVMVDAYEVETAVLLQIGGKPEATSAEQIEVVQQKVREVVYEPASRKMRVTWIKSQ
jgi:site-specific DNA recombinase